MSVLRADAAISGKKRIKANIWIAAHECMVHEMPKAFGKVGLVMVDETPLDAFMFGVDTNDADRRSNSTRCDATAGSGVREPR